MFLIEIAMNRCDPCPLCKRGQGHQFDRRLTASAIHLFLVESLTNCHSAGLEVSLRVVDWMVPGEALAWSII